MFSDQTRIRKQAKFTYYPIGKAFEKQAKTIEEQGEKQRKSLKSLELPNKINKSKQVKDKFQGDQLTNLIKSRLK